MVATFRSHKKAEKEQAKKPQDFLHKLRSLRNWQLGVRLACGDYESEARRLGQGLWKNLEPCVSPQLWLVRLTWGPSLNPEKWPDI